jgi:hypothetical protein
MQKTTAILGVLRLLRPRSAAPVYRAEFPKKKMGELVGAKRVTQTFY